MASKKKLEQALNELELSAHQYRRMDRLND